MKGLPLELVVKDLLLHPSVASYAEVSEHFPCLLNQRHFSDGTYCSVTGRIEQVNSMFFLFLEYTMVVLSIDTKWVGCSSQPAASERPKIACGR